MADVTIDTVALTPTLRAPRNVVWTSASVGYLFAANSNTDGRITYTKTSDGGATWATPVNINTGIGVVVNGFDVWFDQWTAGDSGTLIHIWWFDQGADDVLYRTLNTSTDTLGTERIVFAAVSTADSRNTFISGAKMRGGNLYCVFNLDSGTETGFYRSTDAGVNWTIRTNPLEANGDQCFLFPGNEADNQDCWLLYHDASADELTLKIHDDSADTNAESAGIATVVDNTTDLVGQYAFSGAIRESDGHLIVALVTERDTATADFRVFDINGSGSIVEKTAIATNIDDLYYPQVYIDSGDVIYVAYIGKRDGSETLDTTAGVYYTTSSDGGATWSAGDTAYSATASDWKHAMAAPNGPVFYVAWWDISSAAILGNADNAVGNSSPAATFNALLVQP